MAKYPGKKDIYLNHIILQSDTTINDSIRVDTNIVQQDTTDTVPDTTESFQQVRPELDMDQIDSLLRANEEKEKEFEAQKKVTPPPKRIPEKKTLDTTEALYDIFGVTEMPISKRLEKDPSSVNFLYNIPVYAPADAKEQTSVLEYQTEQQSEPGLAQTQKKELADTHSNWPLFFLLGIFLIIGWTRLFYRKYFDMLIKSSVFTNYAQNLFYERNSLTTRASLLLNTSFFITLGLFAFQIKEHYGVSFLPSILPVYKMLLLSGFFVIWYAWNGIFTTFVGAIFQRQQSFGEYFHNINLFRKMQGIFLFPVAIVVQYIAPELRAIFIITGVTIFVLIYLFHIIRGLQIFQKNNVSIFYLILYLCALEFLPLMFLFEGIVRKI
jgi:hypothetical protein